MSYSSFAEAVFVERGTHRELMRACGYYYSLYTQQYEREAVNKASKMYLR